MSSIPQPVARTLRRSFVVLAIALAGAVVAADGPVALVSGVTLTADSDTGSGERWGRAGGRTITYTVNDVSGYGALSWGNVTGSAPSLAFDNQVNGSEVLVVDFNSNLAGGQAQWTGSAVLPLASGATPTIPTRFTLRVTNAGGGVPLTNIVNGPSPGINVLTSGTFTANLLFEMQYTAAIGGNGDWMPVLDLYDVLPTPQGQPPGQGGPVLTSFQKGFYFSDATTGMTLEQHDANISGKIASVKDDTAFLRIDTVGRLQGVQSSIGSLTQLVQNLPTTQIPQNLATRDDVNRAKGDITEILLVLFGLAPCPDPQLCASATLIPDLATRAGVDAVKHEISLLHDKLDALQNAGAGSALDVEVVEVEERESKRRRWLVRTSLDGSPAVAALTRLMAISTKKRAPSSASDVTSLARVTQVMPGLMDVSIHVSSPNLDDLSFQFDVSHTDGATTTTGSALVGDQFDHK